MVYPGLPVPRSPRPHSPPAPSPDADPAPSDALCAYARDTFKDVEVGDRVLVTGRAVEFNGWTELSPVTAVDVCGTGSIAPTRLRLPAADLEPMENMLLTPAARAAPRSSSASSPNSSPHSRASTPTPSPKRKSVV